MSTFNNEIFDGKTLSDVFKDIYNNSDTKRKQINEFIKKLVMMIKTPEDAAVLGPVIKDFFEVNVKNDEHLVRVAQIAQRVVTIGMKVSGSEGMLTEVEKEQLLKELSIEVAEVKKQAESLNDELSDLSGTYDRL
jgi:predicted  nucleic acid-binding Zn-ribbon protein